MKTRVSIAALVILDICLFLWAFAPKRYLIVNFLDVGQGDCAVIRTPSGKVILIDAGPKTRSKDAGMRVVLPFLRSKGINRIDAILITHPDEDHFGGALSLIEKEPVGELWLSGISTQNQDYAQLLQNASTKSIKVRELHEGDRLDFHDGVSSEILNPSEDLRVSHNNGSIVMLLKYGATSFMLTGDEEKGAEEHTIQDFANLKADVIKVAHHGSKSSSTEELLSAVTPAVGIISVGAHNVYGHPHPDVLKRLENHHIKALRTDQFGEIEATSNGFEIAFHTALRR